MTKDLYVSSWVFISLDKNNNKYLLLLLVTILIIHWFSDSMFSIIKFHAKRFLRHIFTEKKEKKSLAIQLHYVSYHIRSRACLEWKQQQKFSEQGISEYKHKVITSFYKNKFRMNVKLQGRQEFLHFLNILFETDPHWELRRRIF